MLEKVIIVGAAGRDFHNFNVYFKGNPRYRVIAFTAAQIPNSEGRTYPAGLARELYPDGIPICAERDMARLIHEWRIDLAAFPYSDVSYGEVMHKAAIAMAEGADFVLLGAAYTMLKSKKPVIAVCAVRTGAGKSQTTRKIADILKQQFRNRDLRSWPIVPNASEGSACWSLKTDPRSPTAGCLLAPPKAAREVSLF